MNQNLDIYSSAILKPGNVERNIQKKPYAEFFFLSREKEVKSSKYKDSRWLRENVSKVIEGMELKLVTSFCLQGLDLIAAAASEPKANEQGSSLISRRLHYRGLKSLFLAKRKELWLCVSGRSRMHSGMP